MTLVLWSTGTATSEISCLQIESCANPSQTVTGIFGPEMNARIDGRVRSAVGGCVSKPLEQFRMFYIRKKTQRTALAGDPHLLIFIGVHKETAVGVKSEPLPLRLLLRSRKIRIKIKANGSKEASCSLRRNSILLERIGRLSRASKRDQ